MGISIWQLLIVLVIVLLLFGTKRLRHLGSDLGSAVKGFKSAVTDGGKEADEARLEAEEKEASEAAQRVVDGETVEEPAKPNERA